MDLIPPCAGRATPAHRCAAAVPGAPRADELTATNGVSGRRERPSDRTATPHPRPGPLMASGPVHPGHLARCETDFADPPPRRPVRGPETRPSALGPRRVRPPSDPGRAGRRVVGPYGRVPGEEEAA
ncbi:hypothetical protein Srubr_04920 [Streptomyces rubradiris]|uniref:Uncharacterized protein n=1 Tax=Streptomyces rubradiris TaxID=285531 RepID=A0ABQ3R477_STRRR|nr:hypothetical protein GCM10018792_23980 [Streptomyces rubradiris]GHI50646.1 hypothetical protein Srubr_04920 [Streptomyces rubradiris]